MEGEAQGVQHLRYQIRVVLAFCVLLIGLSVVHKPGEDLAQLVSVPMYILVPHHLLTKQIKRRFLILMNISNDRTAH